MRIGITGHQRLRERLSEQGASQSEATAWSWVEGAFEGFLRTASREGLTVVSSLAGGTDQRLSRIALLHGARLEVVVPAIGYSASFVVDGEREGFERLLAHADAVETLGYDQPSEAAFFAAGKRVVDLSDVIIAVWDGQDAEGLGGTGDVVAYARECGQPMLHLDPIRRTINQLPGKE